MTRIAIASFCLLVPAVGHADSSINFMGDTEYVVSQDDADGTQNTFRAPTFDIFATQTEGKFSFVGELVVEAFGSNSFEIDADRLEVGYTPVPWLHLRMGRMRTAFGYYGDAYQNGKFFLTTVLPPTIYEGFAADGIVPSHSVGVHADAKYDLGHDDGQLTLDVEILNGRSERLDEVPAFQDENQSKAVNVRLRYVGQDALAGLVVGGNYYHDDIPIQDSEDVAAAAVIPMPMHETIVGVHAAYVADEVHLISELSYFHHRVHGSDVAYNTLAWFAEAGYTVHEDITPYARFEEIRHSAPDPYFTASEISSDKLDLATVGVKYAAGASVAFKLEGDVDLAGSERRVVMQAAFAF